MLIFLTFLFLIPLLPGDTLRQKLIFSSLTVSLMLTFLTEFLSSLHALSAQSVATSWYLLAGFSLTGCLIRRKAIRELLPSLPKGEVPFLVICVVLLMGIAAEGLLYPPNNWDSLTYHMPRVAHWVNNHSVAPFVTQSYRQIYQPPFAEYFITQLYLLHGSDSLSFATQFFYLIVALVVIFDFSERLGQNRNTSWLAVLLAVTIPSVVLQASTTMNDLVVSYFCLTTLYFCYLSLKENKLINTWGLGLAIGLAMLSKGTAYLLLFPILLTWGILYIKKYKIGKLSILSFVAIGAIVLLINGSFLQQNYQLSGSIFGGVKNEYFVEGIGVKSIISNFVRNGALHASIYPLNNITYAAVSGFLQTLHINPSDPKTSFGSSVFALAKWGHHEDNATSLIHLLIFLFSAVILFRKKDNRKYLVLIVLAQFFCILMLKWQPWSTRFHVALLLISCIPSAAALGYCSRLFRLFCLAACIGYAAIVIVFNPIRPLWSKPPLTGTVSIKSPRLDKYLANKDYSANTQLASDYAIIDAAIKGEKNIGFRMQADIWEYPLLVDSNGKICRDIVFGNVANYTAKLPEKQHEDINIVLSDDTTSSLIFDNKNYLRTQQLSEVAIFTLKK